jgi:hypothetical protein
MGIQHTTARPLFVANASVSNQSTNGSIAPKEDPAIPGNGPLIGSLQLPRPVMTKMIIPERNPNQASSMSHMKIMMMTYQSRMIYKVKSSQSTRIFMNLIQTWTKSYQHRSQRNPEGFESEY